MISSQSSKLQSSITQVLSYFLIFLVDLEGRDVIVRPGAAGLLTGVKYSRVGNSTWIHPTSTVTTRTAVELA